MKLTGRVKISIDSDVLPTEEKKGSLNPGGTKRDPENHDGKTYFTESTEPAKVKFTLLLTKDTDIMKLNATSSATVLFEADTGQQYAVRNCFVTEPVPHEAEGKVDVEMAGDPAEQL